MDVGVVFWIAIAAIVVASIWREVATRRETEKTIRLAIEKGQQLDTALVERLLRPEEQRPDSLLIGGGVVLAAGIGLPIMGYFISLSGHSDALFPLIGVGCLVSLIGIALILFSVYLRKRQAQSRLDRQIA